MNNSLLEPAFLRELEAMRRRLVVRVPSGASGEHLARRRGGSVEFVEHRAYAPGDDLRRVDWMAMARTGEPMVKTFRAEEDVIIRLVVDTSQSFMGEKFLALQRMAAAIGYIALASSERVQMLAFAAGAQPPSRAMRGRSGVPTLLRLLEQLKPEGRTHIQGAVEAAVSRGRPGLLVVLSDFLDPTDCLKALSRARSGGHDVALVHVLDRSEVAPDFTGDVMLEDAETGELVTITADADTLETYLAHLDALIQNLRRWARLNGGTYVRLISDERVEDAVRRVLERRVDA